MVDALSDSLANQIDERLQLQESEVPNGVPVQSLVSRAATTSLDEALDFPTVCATGSISVSSLKGSVIFSTLVSPSNFSSTSYPSRLSYIAKLFAQWQGTIRVSFVFTKVIFQQLKLIISYHPGMFDLNTFNSLNVDSLAALQYSKIFNPNNDVQVDFDIPFICPSVWCDSTRSIGCFSVRIFQPLVASSADINSIFWTMRVCRSPLSPRLTFRNVLPVPLQASPGPSPGPTPIPSPTSLSDAERIFNLFFAQSLRSITTVTTYGGSLSSLVIIPKAYSERVEWMTPLFGAYSEAMLNSKTFDDQVFSVVVTDKPTGTPSQGTVQYNPSSVGGSQMWFPQTLYDPSLNVKPGVTLAISSLPVSSGKLLRLTTLQQQSANSVQSNDLQGLDLDDGSKILVRFFKTIVGNPVDITSQVVVGLACDDVTTYGSVVKKLNRLPVFPLSFRRISSDFAKALDFSPTPEVSLIVNGVPILYGELDLTCGVLKGAYYANVNSINSSSVAVINLSGDVYFKFGKVNPPRSYVSLPSLIY